MKTMEHQTGNEWGVAGGITLSIGSYLLNIDWTIFFEQLSTELIKVAFLGLIGGFAGLMGKKIAERFFFNKKNKR